MAKTVVLTSDMSGDTPARTYTFAWDGIGFEIDLTPDEARVFSEALLPYLEKARALSTGVHKASLVGYLYVIVACPGAHLCSSEPDKGRIPNDVIAEFMEQHSA